VTALGAIANAAADEIDLVAVQNENGGIRGMLATVLQCRQQRLIRCGGRRFRHVVVLPLGEELLLTTAGD
jgi:hypothetical protein